MRALQIAIVGAAVLGIVWLASRSEPGGSASSERGETPAAPETPNGPAELAVPAVKPLGREVGGSAEQENPVAAAIGALESVKDTQTGGLLVRVVDADGKPAGGIGLELVLSITGGRSDDVEKTVTDGASGLGRFSLEGLARQEEALRAMGLSGTFTVLADLASADPIEVPLEGWPTDGDEVDLVLPPLGSMLVSLEGPQGEALEGDAHVHWTWLPAEVAAADPDERYEQTRDHSVYGPAAEPLRIERIGLGVSLKINAGVTGRAGSSTRGVAGPTAPNETVEVTVRVGEPLAELVFRCRDAQGGAIGDEKVRVHVVERTAYSAGPLGKPRKGPWRLRTSSDGEVRMTHQANSSLVERWIEVAAGEAEPRSEDTLDLCAGWVPLPSKLAPGAVVELPDVILAPARAVLEGIVTDPDGAPLENAMVYLNQVLDPGARVAWNRWDWLTRTGEDGRFRILDVARPESLAMRVSAKDHNDRFEDGIVSGGEPLRIVLEPAEPKPRGTLEVQVVMPADVPFLRCRLRLRHEGGRTRSPDWAAGYPMKFDYLTPGRWDVWVETRDGGFELGRVEDVVVREGEVTEDARILPLDLSDRARSLTIVFLHADGTPHRRESIAIGFTETGQGLTARTDDKGVATVLIPVSFQTGRVRGGTGVMADFTVPPDGEPLRITL